jgi:hypothetical protein
MKTYSEAAEYLGRKTERPIPRSERGMKSVNRIVRRDGSTIVLHMHRTDVVRWRADGTTVLDSGGWKTPTTKQRIQDFAAVRIVQEKGEWYVCADGERVGVFADGMVVRADGTYSGAGPIDGGKEREGKKLRRAVRRYCEGFFDAMARGEVHAPYAGDCFFCAMKTEEGKTLGEVTKDKEHLLSHVEEQYFVGSLLESALARFKVCPITRDYVSACWIAQTDGHAQQSEAREMLRHEWTRSIARRDVVKSMYRYVCAELGFAGSDD